MTEPDGAGVARRGHDDTAEVGGDDGRRLHPARAHLGDDSVPCRWWHPDLVGRCARCGSARADLHDGVWGHPSGALLGAPDEHVGIAWTDVQRLQLGLPVDEQWWHHAAGLVGDG